MQKQIAGGRRFFSLALAVRSAAAIVFLFALSTVAMAQSTATLQGTVTDTSNAAVPGAKVVAHNQNTGVDRTTETDQTGGYLVSGLLPGVYQVQISASGFQTSVIKDLTLDVATTVTEDMQLKVGQVTEEVTVTGGTPLVDSSTVAVSQVITQKTVQEIPLNGRHFLDLAILTPGTMTPPQNGFLVDPLQGLGSLGIDTAGQRETTTNLLVNGINLNDEVQNQATFQPSIDTVSEFKIDNSTFPAQYGRNSGAIVNIATRSGTNRYHGEAFDFLRNNYFDARNFFNPVGQPQSPLNRNDFGGDVGGPIKHNKAFFFLSYEGVRQLHALNLVTPVPAQGTTSSDATVNNLLKLLPAPTGTLNGQPAFFGATNAPVNEDIGTADASVNLTQNDELHGYYAIEKDHRFEPTSGTNLPGFGDTRDGFRQLLTISENHIFSPNLTNQVNLGFNRLHITFLPNDSSLTPSSLGINLPPGVPQVGIPSIIIQSLGLEFGNPTGEPQGRGDTTVGLTDTVSWLRGRHSFDFGGDISRFYNNNIGNNVGQFVYSSLTNFLNDQAATFSTTQGNSDNRVLMPSWGLFAQDSFKWKPNVTINLGVRYDWNSTPSEATNRISEFDPTTDAMVQVGTGGLNQPFQTNNKNFQPRVGIAWDPWGDGKTSVRAGYALLTQQPTTNIISSGNPPFAIPLFASSNPSNITLENPPANPRTVSPFTIAPNYHDAYAQDWNLTIQRELTNTLGIQVAYIGSKNTHLQQEVNLNQPLVIGGIYQPKSTAPFPNFSEIAQVTSNGNSNYNALWVTLHKQVTHGFEFLTSYTYSKSLDYSSLDFPNNLPQDSNNLRNEYGPSDFNATNRFVFSGFYSLPFKGNRAVTGWQLAIVSQAQSGNPLTAYMTGVSGLFPGVTIRPNVSGHIQVTGNPANWITNPSVFSSPCTGSGSTLACSPGNEGRNTIIGPSFVNTDFSLIKDTKITGRVKSEFRAEAFDIFNHPNFGDPNLNVGSSTFGVITSTRFPTGDFGSSRQLQFALKLIF
ncbi:MAG: TonB-dependent receptor [Candidatus Acidiferrales bacterium]